MLRKQKRAQQTRNVAYICMMSPQKPSNHLRALPSHFNSLQRRTETIFPDRAQSRSNSNILIAILRKDGVAPDDSRDPHCREYKYSS